MITLLKFIDFLLFNKREKPRKQALVIKVIQNTAVKQMSLKQIKDSFLMRCRVSSMKCHFISNSGDACPPRRQLVPGGTASSWNDTFGERRRRLAIIDTNYGRGVTWSKPVDYENLTFHTNMQSRKGKVWRGWDGRRSWRMDDFKQNGRRWCKCKCYCNCKCTLFNYNGGISAPYHGDYTRYRPE